MAGVKITKFLGVAPRSAPELLPDTAAQVARNCKLYSGNLDPYPEPVPVAGVGLSETVRTLFALRNPITAALEWLAWAADVDIAVATPKENDDQRFYFTGDGVPKVSNYEFYPFAFDLGLPIPPNRDRLTTIPTPTEEMVVNTFSRDSGNTTRLVTTQPHNLRTGALVTISGFTQISGGYTRTGTLITFTASRFIDLDNPGLGTVPIPHGLSEGASVQLTFTSGNAVSGVYTVESVPSSNTFTVTSATSGSTSGGALLSLKTFNGTNVEITKVNDTTFEYFNPGPPVSELTVIELREMSPRVNLSGLTQARSYVYTWYTPWEEESIASKPSEELFIKEGQIVTLTSFPTIKPPGNNYVRGLRLYRTLPSLSGTEYFRLATLWFPTPLASVFRNHDVSRVTTPEGFPHNLSIDDVFRIDDCGVPSFNIIDGVVTDVIDQYTFEYAQEGAATPDTPVANGMIHYDVSEDPGVSDARYWGFGGDYSFTDDFDSKLLLDVLETDEFEAPPKDLQGLIQIGGDILAGFVGNELFFSEPGRPHAWPKEYSKVVEHDIVGLAATTGSVLVTTESYPYVVSVTDPAAGASVIRIDVQYPCLNRKSIVTMAYGVVYATHNGLAVFSAGAQIITQQQHHSDTWNENLSPATLVAAFYGDAYIAAHSAGGLVFERDEQTAGNFVDLDTTFSAVWYDALTHRLYFTKASDATVYEWNVPAQPRQTQLWKSKVIKTADMLNLGAARVLADYSATQALVWNSVTTNWQDTAVLWNSGSNVIFRMWVDRELIYEAPILDKGTFRLPTGYRADTFEVGVESNIPIRSVHLAETPLGLKAV